MRYIQKNTATKDKKSRKWNFCALYKIIVKNIIDTLFEEIKSDDFRENFDGKMKKCCSIYSIG
jgi:hypothetical protein